MLCFNKRLGCFDRERTQEIVDHLQRMFATLQISITMPIKTFKYFRTPLYKQFEKSRIGLEKYVLLMIVFSSKTMTILTAKIEQNNDYINSKNRAKQ
jgi:hypothetical protein